MNVGKETVVVITGASSGIGEATALAFARRGAKVFLAARRLDRLEAVAKRCLEAGSPAAEAFRADLSVPGDGARLVEEAVRRLGRVDVLVANAGYGNFGTVAEYPPEKMARMMQVNFLACYESIYAALAHMKKAGRGHLFMVSSIVGRRALPFAAAYCATKFAQAGLGEALHFELRGTGIHSTTICPGLTDTEFPDRRDVSGNPVSLSFKRKGQPPAVIAEAIVGAVGTDRREIHFSAVSRAALLADRAAPWLIDWAVARGAKKAREQQASSGKGRQPVV